MHAFVGWRCGKVSLAFINKVPEHIPALRLIRFMNEFMNSYNLFEYYAFLQEYLIY
jgi:hypothetical protein